MTYETTPTYLPPVLTIKSHSPTFGALAAALAKAQASIEAAPKDKTNPHYRSKYADLNGIWESIRKPLSENQLAVVQSTRVENSGQVILVTNLLHSSGEWISGEYPVVSSRHDAQGIGAGMTYARRYALSAMVGASVDDDDDGETAQGRGKGKQTDQDISPEYRPKGNGSAQANFAPMPLAPLEQPQQPTVAPPQSPPSPDGFYYYSITRIQNLDHQAGALNYLEDKKAEWVADKQLWKSARPLPMLINHRVA